jgi:hypothetical protein
MASASLNKMTVPLASDQSASAQGLLMPKLKYRFRVLFQNFGVTNSTTEMTKQVVSVARPNLTFEEIALPIYNSTLKLAGRHTWADIACSVRDDASGSVMTLVGEQMQKQLDFLEQASAAAGIDYKFMTTIQILDGGNGADTPVVLEQWELYGCYLKGADYGELNYGTNEGVTINLTIAYDNAAQVKTSVNDGGVGTLAGRVAGARSGGSVTGVGLNA